MPAKRARGPAGVSARTVPAAGATARARASHDAVLRAQLALALPDELIEAIAHRAAALVGVSGPEPWIGVDDAAAHLSCPRSRVYRLVSRRAIPFEKDGARLLFKRSELDAWVQRGGAK